MSHPPTKRTDAKRAARVLTLVALLLCCALDAGAQSKTTQRGFQPGGSYAGGDIETINTTNGNMMLRVPLGSLPAGRAGMGYGINLLYNSKLYERADTRVPDGFGGFNTVTYLSTSEDGGWRYGVTYDLKLTVKDFGTDFPQCDNIEGYYRYRLEMRFPDGGSHEFRPQGFRDDYDDGWFAVAPGGQRPCQQPAITSTISYFSTDGTYMRLDVAYDANPFDAVDSTWTLYFPDGRRVTGGGAANQRIYDRNSNYVEIQNTTYNTHPAVKLVDQFDRKVILEYGSAANQDTVHAWGFNNEPMQTVITWKSITVDRGYATDGPSCCGIGAGPFGFSVVDQVLLPLQAGTPRLAYTFGYNASSSTSTVGWGEVSSVTLPSGAQTAYHWKWDNSDSINPPRWEDVLKDSPTQKDLTYQQEYDGASTPATETWQYEINELDNRITAPDGGVTREYWYGGSSTEQWKEKLVYKVENPDGSVTERLWATNTPYIFYSGSYGPKFFNALVKKEFNSIRNAAGALVKTAIKESKYDKNGNTTEVREYDWVSYGSVPRDAQGRPSGVPGGAPLMRVATSTYYNPTPDSSDILIDDPDEYHKATSSRVRNAQESSEVGNGTQTLSRSEVFYDNPSTTANATEQRSWDSHKGGTFRALTRPLGFGGADNYISTSQQYDTYGNQTLLTDANGNQTQLTYGLVNGFTGLYPTVTEVAFGSPVERTTTTEYDFYTGAATRTTDVDNNVSTATAYDVFGRPTLVKSAEGKPDEMRAQTIYSDVERRVTSRSDMNTLGDGKQVTIQYYDQLGRVRLSRELEDASAQSETDETTGIKIQTRYKFSGAVSYLLVSNPYRAARAVDAGGEVTMGWTETISDQGGRVVRAETFSGAALPAPWGGNTSTTGAVTTSYDAEATSVVDQAGKERKSVSDRAGRVVQVFEAPNAAGYNYQTSYTYNALGNLTQVTQGQQTRTLTYSSRSRLISATNPEVCQQQQAQCNQVPVTYEYDANGNVKKKTDARGTQANYSYDALNRITACNYTGGTAGTTPPVAYFYDSQQLPANAPVFDRGLSVGKLVAVTYGGGALGNYTGGYDTQGRARLSRQVTDDGTAGGAKTYLMSYDYYLDGRPKTVTYPSGKVVETKYDTTGKIAGVKNQGGIYYAGGDPDTPNNPAAIKYTAHGAAETLKLGNGLWEHLNFNSRLQPVQLGLGTSGSDSSLLQLDNSYGTTDNSGNVKTQTITVPGMPSALRQEYSYDHLNRLTLARETKVGSGAETWKQAYTYADQNGQNGQFGNRRIDTSIDPTTSQPRTTANVTPQSIPQINPANNRFSEGQGYSYDAAGNLTAAPGHTYQYDAENQMTSLDGGATATAGANYYYDGNGKRIKKVEPARTTVFVYDMAGRLVAEYSNQVNYGGTSYVTQDGFGNTRAVSNQSGTVVSRHDYLPFGEEVNIATVNNSGRESVQSYNFGNVRQKFAGKERDSETGLDYFGARYYSSETGRFTSTDSSGPDLTNPQTFNQYRYCLNNPLRYVDPDGQYEEDVHYDLTRVLAYAAGFSLNDATAIARETQGPDNKGDFRNPEHPHPFSREMYHFTTEQRRQEMWDIFEKNAGTDPGSRSPRNLGEYLHALEDKFSHEVYDALFGQAVEIPKSLAQGKGWNQAFEDAHRADYTDTDPDKANTMARATFDALVRATNVVRGNKNYNVDGRPISYGAISGLIDQFSRESDRGKKQQILEKIMGKIARARRLHESYQLQRSFSGPTRNQGDLMMRMGEAMYDLQIRGS